MEDHQKDIQKFQTASQTAADADVKAFAQKTLPVLQQHLKMAQDIKADQTSTGSPSSETGTSSSDSSKQLQP